MIVTTQALMQNAVHFMNALCVFMLLWDIKRKRAQS
jgi:hypothetical protein